MCLQSILSVSKCSLTHCPADVTSATCTEHVHHVLFQNKILFREFGQSDLTQSRPRV